MGYSPWGPKGSEMIEQLTLLLSSLWSLCARRPSVRGGPCSTGPRRCTAFWFAPLTSALQLEGASNRSISLPRPSSRTFGGS